MALSQNQDYIYFFEIVLILYVFFLLQRLKAAVVQEYKVTKNSQFQRVRDEFQYLHKKLEHIKQLVHDYDTRFDTKSLSQQPRSLTASS